jgi:hypothetical protein
MNYLISIAGLTAFIVTLCFYQGTSMFFTKRSIAPASATMNKVGFKKQTQAKALELWEQAISAKGGRERLYSVYSLAVSTQTAYLTQTGKRNQVRREYLFVLPNKYWSYEDYGSDIFGTRMHMLNYETNMQYVGSQGHPETILEPITGVKRNKDINYLEIALLLETKWQKPIPLKPRTALIGRKRVDVVQTAINGRRVDFALDRATHLPMRITFYNTVNNKVYADVQELSDYTEVDGIKVPQRLKFDDGTEGTSIVHFNVEYDPDIFLKPPPSGSGPKAWQATRNTSSH